MKERKITGRQLADVLGIEHRSVTNKMNGTTPITFDEAIAIRDFVQPGGDLETLFQRDGNGGK